MFSFSNAWQPLLNLITLAASSGPHVIRLVFIDVPLTDGCHSMLDFAVMPVLINKRF